MVEIAGSVYLKGTDEYETARRSALWWGHDLRRFPDVIVQVADEAEVATAVRFARANGLRISTRSGGHTFTGAFIRDGGMMLDLSRLNSIDVDPHHRAARVGPAVRGGDLQAVLGTHGLAFPAGHVASVAVGGFLLGGGIGLNSVAWGGTSCVNVRGIDVVTADGEILYADETHNADFWWAARGAGPGLFFVVTRLHLDCFPEPRHITTTSYRFDLAELGAIGRALADVGPQVAPALELMGSAVRLGGKGFAAVTAHAFADDEAEATRMLEPLERHPQMARAVERSHARVESFAELTPVSSPLEGMRGHGDSAMSDDVISASDILHDHLRQSPVDYGTGLVWRGPAPSAAGALPVHANWLVEHYALWTEPEDDVVARRSVAALFADLEAYSAGPYGNEFDAVQRPEATPRCFTPETWRRLAELREIHDPARVFHAFLGLE